MREPLPWHPPILEYCRKHPCGALFCDKRLGKTYLAGRWAHMHGAEKVLVVAPYSALPGWTRQLEEDGDLVWDLTVPQNMKTWIEERNSIPARFFVVNPQGLFRAGRGQNPFPREAALHEWDAVIWDELPIIKTPRSQINTVAHMCLGNIPLRLGLSGEYAEEGVMDIFEQMRWVFGSFMGHINFYKWQNEFFDQILYDWFPKTGVTSLGEIKRIVMERAYVLSRKDAGLKEHREFDPRYCDLPREVRKVYDHAETYFEIPGVAIPDGAIPALQRKVRYTSYITVVRNWLLQISGGRPKDMPDLNSDHKLKLMMEIVRERKHEPLVISFRHREEMFAAKDYLAKQNVTDTALMYGDMNVKQRTDVENEFKKGTIGKVLKTAMVHFGADLSAADTMIRYSLPDRYRDLSQDADRIVSPVKKRPLLYIDLITKRTVDEDLSDLAADKSIDARFFMSRLTERMMRRCQEKNQSFLRCKNI